MGGSAKQHLTNYESSARIPIPRLSRQTPTSPPLPAPSRHEPNPPPNSFPAFPPPAHQPPAHQPPAYTTTATMSTPLPLPRFLLPQSSSLWRTTTTTLSPLPRRLASTKPSPSKPPKPSGPRVLAQPERFNPPSHGARLPRAGGPRQPQHYGGALSQSELLAQVRKEYPGLMAPMGSLAYRVIYSKWIHLTITLVSLPPPRAPLPR